MSEKPILPNSGSTTALTTIMAGLEMVQKGVAMMLHEASDASRTDESLNPKDSRNKYQVGGVDKLTERGVEVCYRLFDKGMSRYAVANALNISFGAAHHRWNAWQQAGGLTRAKRPLD